jgi:hypothetical protein
MSELRARKQMLVAESDIYRETLRLEVHNLRVYGAGLKRKFSVFRAMNPLLLVAAGMMGAPLGRTLVRRRKRNWLRLTLTSLLSWRVYRQLAPLLRPFIARFSPRPESMATAAEERVPAANI